MWRPPHDWIEPEAVKAWRDARPFPHVIVDDVVAERDLPGLIELLEEEPVQLARADLYAFEASAVVPTTAAFAAMRDAFAAAFAPALSALTGRPVTRVDMRAYAYHPGHFLLPHTDHQDGLGRQLAYAYYLPSPQAPDGGELELFAATLASEVLVDIAPAIRIAPRGNRLVVFEVGPTSLHQVREVEAGLRPSLAGWFYA